MNKTKSSPLVSVIIPTHNRAGLLPRAINSVLSQTYKNYEIIIIDDGSSDNTQEILSGFASNKLRILKNEMPKGACNARNRGIKAAAGDLLAFLDDDDEYLPVYLEEMTNAYDPKWAYLSSNFSYICRTSAGVKKHVRKKSKYVTPEKMLYTMCSSGIFLVEKNKIIRIGGFDEALLKSQDYDVLLRLNLRFGTACNLQKILFIVHGEHESPRITFSPRRFHALWYFYKKHKHLYSKRQKKYRLYMLMCHKNKPVTLKKFFWLVPVEYFPVNIKLILKKNIARIKGERL